MKKDLKIAFVHDWLTGMRGGEKVLEVLCELFPHATLFTLVHNRGSVSEIIEGMKIKTSLIQKLPKSSERYQYYLPLMPYTVERFDLHGYDFIFSSSHAVAKGVKCRRDAVHICYCHTPMRYIWDQYENYFGKGKSSWAAGAAMKIFRDYLRRWDVESSGGVNYFIANSKNVQGRIKRIYGRDSEVIYPPVDAGRFEVSKKDDGYYLIVSALVPYKRIDIAVEAFNELGERLLIVGIGSEMDKLKKVAKPNIEFKGWASDKQVANYYAGCKALIFPGEEDFGIVPLESMASGKPVIAFARGGALETVVEDKTGIFFQDQTKESLIDAMRKLKTKKFDADEIRKHALSFDRSLFKEKIQSYIEKMLHQNL